MIRNNNKKLSEGEQNQLADLIRGYGNLQHYARLWRIDEQTVRNIARRGYGHEQNVKLIQKKLRVANVESISE